MLIRFKGRVTNELLAVSYRTAKRYATVMDASASIMDCSLVTEFDVSADLIRQLANQEPVLSDPTRPRFIVASKALVFGCARMFQDHGRAFPSAIEGGAHHGRSLSCSSEELNRCTSSR